eukprot:TRINITY_DN8764_c1_g1_i1.p4 TRINITY_DN8764_c1_g1~~TRINITY_DN8764_c1_g1_i1.p4  ORF type:complete len:102 (+),score=8.42 TRINITY_DN8764_c1_g1_i1:72-377(+)
MMSPRDHGLLSSPCPAASGSSTGSSDVPIPARRAMRRQPPWSILWRIVFVPERFWHVRPWSMSVFLTWSPELQRTSTALVGPYGSPRRSLAVLWTCASDNV